MNPTNTTTLLMDPSNTTTLLMDPSTTGVGSSPEAGSNSMTTLVASSLGTSAAMTTSVPAAPATMASRAVTIIYVERSSSCTALAIALPITFIFITLLCLYFWHYFYIRGKEDASMAGLIMEKARSVLVTCRSCLAGLRQPPAEAQQDPETGASRAVPTESQSTLPGQAGDGAPEPPVRGFVRSTLRQSMTALPVTMRQYMRQKRTPGSKTEKRSNIRSPFTPHLQLPASAHITSNEDFDSAPTSTASTVSSTPDRAHLANLPSVSLSQDVNEGIYVTAADVDNIEAIRAQSSSYKTRQNELPVHSAPAVTYPSTVPRPSCTNSYVSTGDGDDVYNVPTAIMTDFIVHSGSNASTAIGIGACSERSSMNYSSHIAVEPAESEEGMYNILPPTTSEPNPLQDDEEEGLYNILPAVGFPAADGYIQPVGNEEELCEETYAALDEAIAAAHVGSQV